MGLVVLARDLAVGGRPVAVKLLRQDHEEGAAGVRFAEEARTLAALRHENIVAVHDLIQEQGRLLLVMDYVPGTSLAELIQAGPLDPRNAAEVALKVASALACAHGSGIMHRDVKPANVLLSAERQVFLVDFGVAKRHDRSEVLTRTGAMIGTPTYMSPEQVRDGRLVDERSDVYSLGATLYEMLVGEPPFVGEDLLALLCQVAGEPPQTPIRRRPDLDLALSSICMRCLEKNPDARYQGAAELVEDLSAYLSGGRVSVGPPRRYTSAVVVGLLALTLCLGLALLFVRSGDTGGSSATSSSMSPEDLELLVQEAREATAAEDWVNARRLQLLAAEEGDVAGMQALGSMLVRGLGGPKDESRGLEWLRKAADQGSASALYNLGASAFHGQGQPKDEAQAVAYFLRAAEGDNARAMYALGVIHRTQGEAVAAREWFERAATGGDSQAMVALGNTLLALGEDEESTRWYRSAAEAGEAAGMTNLAHALLEGRGVDKDVALAATWYHRAAEQGHVAAMLRLTNMHQTGLGVPKDDELATRWCRRAAEAGNVKAMAYLASLLEAGLGVEQSSAKAREWFYLAAEKGDSEAMNRLGFLLGSGRGGSQDEARAVHWYRRAAELGHHGGMVNLGNVLATGRGATVDWKEAESLFRSALASRNPQVVRGARGGLASLERLKAAPVEGTWHRELVAQGKAPRLPAGVKPSSEPGEYVNEADGSILVYLARGSTRWSCALGDHGGPHEHTMSVEGFLLGKYEVSQAQFARFNKLERKHKSLAKIRYRGSTFEVPPDHPVVGVSWHAAAAYCQRNGLRLPTVTEWTYACHVGGRSWPWGDAPPGPALNNLGRWSAGYMGDARDVRDGFPHTAPVTAFAKGCSKSGCFNLYGNVSEWLSAEPDGKQGRLIGGSWNVNANVMGEGRRDPTSRWPDVGFRVARSLGR
jgi:TPR repeat protein/predicted Ser/Thr protein kinase